MTSASTGKAVYLPGGSKTGQRKQKAFAGSVKWAAILAMRGGPMFLPLTPLAVTFVFYLAKPKSNGDALPIRPPDLDKITRNANDALRGIVFDDDARIVDARQSKRWATEAEPPGVWICVSEVTDLA